jgi:RimJ/RimL family protein N-acetyltransferase
VDKPRLATKRTTLDPIGLEDISTTHALWTDPDVRRYLWDGTVITEEQAAEVVASSDAHFARHGFGLWAVRTPDSSEFMGVCGFRPSAAGEPELLFAFWPRFWGKGLAFESACAVIAYVFEVLDRSQIVAATDVPNQASSRALERVGMQLERRGELNGLDTYFYRLTREQFQLNPPTTYPC